LSCGCEIQATNSVKEREKRFYRYNPMAEEQVAKIRDEKPCSPETGLDQGAESLTQEIYWTVEKRSLHPPYHNSTTARKMDRSAFLCIFLCTLRDLPFS
jgi:hypothetical protein